jgi:hypothetical protein
MWCICCVIAAVVALSIGAINYPFSAREAVAVVRHLQAFPGDSVATAVENILAFDGSNSHLRRTIALIFQQNGLLVPVERVVFEHPDSSGAGTGV